MRIQDERKNQAHSFQCVADWAGNEGLSTSATSLPPHSKKETMRRGRRPAQRMAADPQIEVSGDPRPGKKREPTNKGEAAPFPMLINMRTRNDEAGLTPQELFTPIAQEPSPYTAWRATPCPKADTKLTTTHKRNDA